MQRKNNKDYLEKLINHTMRHGKKIAAIGLLAKSVSVFVQKLAHQGIISDSISFRRVSTRPRLSSTLLNHPQMFGQLKTDNSHPTYGPIGRNINSPTLFFSIIPPTTKPVTVSVKNEKRKGKVRRPVERFVKDAISHLKPSLETRKKKIAGITRHVPSIVSPSRGEGLAIRWVLAAAKEKQRKGGKELSKCLSDELLDAYLKRGEARQKRDSLHKLAESNRSYVRYRWW
jgi:small subunit ribosomal protein S7